MAFYVVQHGLSLQKQEDPQKGLSSEGRRQVERIAQVAAGYQVPVERIEHSGKKRAEQSAHIFGEYLKPQDGIHAVVGINPLDEVSSYAAAIDMQKSVMVVGHLPFLERLIAHLITGQTEKPVMRLQNGGIVCLDVYPDSDDVIVKWALMPNVS